MRGSPVSLRKTVPCLLALAFVCTALAGCMETTDTGLDDPVEGDSGDAETGAGGGDGSGGTDSSSRTDASGGGGTAWSAPATGQLLVYIKDAPTDHFSEIWVNVTAVEVHLAPGSVNNTSEDGNETTQPNGNETTDSNGNQTTDSNGNQTTDSNGNQTTDSNGNETTEPKGNETAGNDDGGNASSMDGGWIVVVNETRSIDLLSFSEADSKAFLGDAELSAGRYTQIRLHISDAWGIRAEDNGTEEIKLANNVAKIVRSFQIDPDGSTEIVIDVDLDRSVRSYGPPHAPHGWRMTPVIGKVLVAQDPTDETEDIPDSE